MCKPSRSATYLETQSSDWVLSFKSKEVFPCQGTSLGRLQHRAGRPCRFATYSDKTPQQKCWGGRICDITLVYNQRVQLSASPVVPALIESLARNNNSGIHKFLRCLLWAASAIPICQITGQVNSLSFAHIYHSIITFQELTPCISHLVCNIGVVRNALVCYMIFS